MRRRTRLDLCQDVWPSEDDFEIDDTMHGQSHSPTLSTAVHRTQPSMPSNPTVSRLSLLPAYPTFDRHGAINRDHLLLANVPRQNLTIEQRRRRDYHTFHQPFTLIDQSHNDTVRPFFVYIYQHMYDTLARRFHVDNAILDYNYERLRECINIMTQERIRYGLHPENTVGSEQLRIDEYALALEFYLQMDADLFFMKTCSFRSAQPSIYNHPGIFCIDPPQAHYGITLCHNVSCRFCYPIKDIIIGARREEPVIRFSAAQKHQFVNGYEAILNCPVSCTTRNILYALTCPCGQVDYIGYTSISLGECLTDHREHGNRIIHEYILGPENIGRVRPHSKSKEEVAADDMLLYKHSARCSSAIQMFLDCNPRYWCFIPMTKIEAQAESSTSSMSKCIPVDPTSTLLSSHHIRRHQEAEACRKDLPPVPSEKYTFSVHQRAKQFEVFKEKCDRLMPNFDLDLYHAAIIAVLPDNCSDMLYRIIEALFITHAQTKLNTLGHLDGMTVENKPTNYSTTEIVADRGDWCRDLIRRPTLLHQTMTSTSYRGNPHFQ